MRVDELAPQSRRSLKPSIVLFFDSGFPDPRSRRKMAIEGALEISRSEGSHIAKKMGGKIVVRINSLGHNLDKKAGKAVEIHIDPSDLGHRKTGDQRNGHMGGKDKSKGASGAKKVGDGNPQIGCHPSDFLGIPNLSGNLEEGKFRSVMDQNNAVSVSNLSSQGRNWCRLYDVFLGQGKIMLMLDDLNDIKPYDHNRKTGPKKQDESAEAGSGGPQ